MYSFCYSVLGAKNFNILFQISSTVQYIVYDVLRLLSNERKGLYRALSLQHDLIHAISCYTAS